jgi:DNA modification methylase
VTHKLHRGDCLEILPALPEASVQLIVTSPPYGVGWRYADDGSGDLPTEATYWALLTGFIDGALHVLRDGGVLVLNLPSDTCIRAEHGWGEEYRAYPIADKIRCHLFDERRRGWLLHQKVIWNKGHGDGDEGEARTRVLGNACNFWFRPCHEELIIASKWSYRIPNRGPKDWPIDGYRDALKTVQRWPWGRARQAEPLAFPPELADWAIRLFSEPGDVVLDPFAGTGTVGKVARQLGREARLIEREPRYWLRLEAVLGQGVLMEVV